VRVERSSMRPERGGGRGAFNKADVTGPAGKDALPGIRAVVRAVLHAFGGRQRARKILIGLGMQAGWHQQLEHPVAALLTSGSVASQAGGAFTLGEVDAFVLTQAVVGVIRAALVRDEPRRSHVGLAALMRTYR
jgi:hypothetical protein